jgi:DNA-binding transcriptional LysR family regulator
MNLTRLQTFVAVVRSGTFAGAADALMFTPSAVSQQMAKLEAEIGAPLLVRDARGAAGHGGRVALTDAGRILHERALVILAAVRETQCDIDALRGDRLRRLRLGSFPAATAGIVPRALRLFRRRLPSTEVELLELDAAALREGRLGMTLAGETPFDLAVVGEVVTTGDAALAPPIPPASPAAAGPALAEVTLARAPLSLAMPTGHPLAAHERLDLAALDGVVVVGSASMPEIAELMRRCAAAGAVPVLTGWRVPDPHALVQLAAAGEGLALVPALLADTAPPRTVLRPLEGGPEWELRALRPAGDIVPVTTLAMLEALRAVATIEVARKRAPLAAA